MGRSSVEMKDESQTRDRANTMNTDAGMDLIHGPPPSYRRWLGKKNFDTYNEEISQNKNVQQ